MAGATWKKKKQNTASFEKKKIILKEVGFKDF